MTEREMARPGTQGDGPGSRSWPPGRLAMLAGSVTALLTAGLAGGALAFVSQAAFRAGGWNVGIEQYQAPCFTDIHPLCFSEQLPPGKVPLLGHPVEDPVRLGSP